MKKLIFLFLVVTGLCTAQDTLVLSNKQVLCVKVTEIATEIIKYKKCGMLDGPTFVSDKSAVSYIIYSNGVKENIDSLYKLQKGNQQSPGDYSSIPKGSEMNMYTKGDNDARVFYTNGGGSVGVGLSAFFCGVLGLIPAGICASVDPKVQNLNYPSEELWQNKYYQKGYRYRAKKIKQKKVWTGFGIGFGASLALFALLSVQ